GRAGAEGQAGHRARLSRAGPVVKPGMRVATGEEFLDLLTAAERAELERRGSLRRWDRGQVVFAEDDRSDWVVGLVDGRVKLAGWVGASREAVTKSLAALRARGWIETSRRTVIIRDLPALRRRAH